MTNTHKKIEQEKRIERISWSLIPIFGFWMLSLKTKISAAFL